MRYVALDTDKFVRINDELLTSSVFSREKHIIRANEIIVRLAAIPPDLSDVELLAWAKANHPAFDYSRERNSLEQELSTINADLEATE